MIPASFAPMILKMILGKKILPKLLETISVEIINKIEKMFKLRKLLGYMELPNDADRVGEKNSKEIEKLKIEYKALRDIVIDGL